MTKFLQKATLGIVAATLAAAAQATLIDDFSTNQLPMLKDLTTDDSGLWSQVSGTGILGSYRDLFVTKTLGDPAIDGTSIGVHGGLLRFSNDTEQGGVGIVRWDGNALGSGTGLAAAIASINPIGLGGIDLAADALGFEIVVHSADAGFNFTLQAYTSATDWSQITLPATPGPGTHFIPFAAFVMGGTAAVNWADIGALQAIINYPGTVVDVDLSIRRARAVPEPASIALVGMALLAAGVASRRRIG